RGAALAEGEVVFARATLVAMPLDRDGDVSVPLHPLGLALQDLLALGGDVGAIVREEDPVAGRRRQVLLRARRITGGARADPGGSGADAGDTDQPCKHRPYSLSRFGICVSPRAERKAPYPPVSSGADYIVIFYRSKGDHAGSEASPGVLISRWLLPVRS